MKVCIFAASLLVIPSVARGQVRMGGQSRGCVTHAAPHSTQGPYAGQVRVRASCSRGSCAVPGCRSYFGGYCTHNAAGCSGVNANKENKEPSSLVRPATPQTQDYPTSGNYMSNWPTYAEAKPDTPAASAKQDVSPWTFVAGGGAFAGLGYVVRRRLLRF